MDGDERNKPDRPDGQSVHQQTVRVTAHRCSPDRIVLTEEDNTEGWIASDLTVAPEQ